MDFFCLNKLVEWGGGSPLYKKYATLTPERFYPEGLKKMKGAKNSVFEQKMLVYLAHIRDIPSRFLCCVLLALMEHNN